MNYDVAYQEIAYYEYYDYETRDHVSIPADPENPNYCYTIYTPKGAELDASTPVIAYVSHGGGVADEEIVFALSCAVSTDTEAIFVVPRSDRPEVVCALLADARDSLDGKGDFGQIRIHGTSSGGRAVIRTALESVNPDADYGLRFEMVCAYDPAQETPDMNISGQTEKLGRLAEQGTVLFIQTDQDVKGYGGGSGWFCNEYARAYSEAGGAAVIAEIYEGNHEGKFIQPMTHNSLNWSIGRGALAEDYLYRNRWFAYQDGRKISSTLEEVTRFLQDSPESPQGGLGRKNAKMYRID